jgi:hypothetical protein
VDSNIALVWTRIKLLIEADVIDVLDMQIVLIYSHQLAVVVQAVEISSFVLLDHAYNDPGWK